MAEGIRAEIEHVEKALAEAPDAAQLERSTGGEKIASSLLKRAFLDALSRYGTVNRAKEEVARIYGVVVSRMRVGSWVKYDKKFRDRYIMAAEDFNDRLEDAAYERGVEGWEEPVYQQGQLVGSKRVYSDSLLQMLLKGSRPQKYRDVVGVQHQTAAEMKEALNRELARLSLLPQVPAETPVDAEIVTRSEPVVAPTE